MLRVRRALALSAFCGFLAAGGPWLASAASGPIASTQQLSLHECRLEHPLRLASLAARCGVLKVPEDRTAPAGATIDLSIAVVPALNRRTTAAPLFLLAGGAGLGALAAVYVATWRITDERDRLRLDRLAPK